MIKVEKLEAFPPEANPFHHDWFQMGQYHASNVAVMFATFDHEKAAHIDVINRETGERVRIHFGSGSFGHFVEEKEAHKAHGPRGVDFSWHS